MEQTKLRISYWYFPAIFLCIYSWANHFVTAVDPDMYHILSILSVFAGVLASCLFLYIFKMSTGWSRALDLGFTGLSITSVYFVS